MQRYLTTLIPFALLLPLTACAIGTDGEEFESGSAAASESASDNATEQPAQSDEWPATGGTGGSQGEPGEWPDNGRHCEEGQVQTCTTSCGTEGTQNCDGNGVWEACEPDATESICNDGLDNDCDGRVDGSDLDCPGTTETCEESNGNNCNGDMGYGDRCDPSDNENGCSDEKFWAWCNRRNSAYPNIWEDWIRNWVDSHCDGDVTKTDDQYAIYRCTDSTNITYECTTPLVLAFDDEAVTFTRSEHAFSLTPHAGAARTDWPSAATPWLALDRNGDGMIGDGRELFGSATVLGTGATAAHGFEALAELDDVADGVIDRSDAVWSHLLVWRDENGDGVSEPGELTRVMDEGLERIALGYTAMERCDARGNCERERSTFAWLDRAGARRQGAVIDVHLRLQPALCR